MFPSAATASKEYRVFANPDATGCLVSFFQQTLDTHTRASGVTTGHASGNAVAFPHLGDGAVAFEMSVPVSVTGFSGNVEVEAVVVRRAASVAYLTLTSIGSAFPVTLAHQLATRAATRLAA